MRLARSAHVLRSDAGDVLDAPPFNDVAFDPPSDFVPDVMPDFTADALHEALPDASRARRRRDEPRGAPPPVAARLASVCLSCGASPPEGGECAHEEVAHLTDASPVVMAVVHKLQAAVLERLNQERALRRVVAAEVSAGRGDVVMPERASAPVEPTMDGPCTRCGHRVVLGRAARRRALAEAQGAFGFAELKHP